MKQKDTEIEMIERFGARTKEQEEFAWQQWMEYTEFVLEQELLPASDEPKEFRSRMTPDDVMDDDDAA